MQQRAAKVTSKVKTKGRFQVEIPTNGTLNRTDTLWARKANPLAYKAQEQRDLADLKMLEKKKKTKLAASMWEQKQSKEISNPLSPASGSDISLTVGLASKTASIVRFADEV